MKHLLKLLDMSGEEIIEVLNLADQLKYETKHGIEHHHLKGRCLGMIFEKSSTRTRVSFEVGINQLGGYAVVLASEGSQIGRGEPVQDTARVLSRYVDGIMIRTFEQQEVEDLAKYGSVPVINGLTDFCHPCQVLADLMTIREFKGSFDGLKMCFIGDGKNMMNSLIVGGLKVGMSVSVACPEGYRPPQEILDFANGYGCFELTDDPMQAAKTRMLSLPTCGLLWARRTSARNVRLPLRATALTKTLWPRPSPTLWSSTACLPTEARRLPRRYLRQTPSISLRRPKTACMRRRRSW